jgi:hypothetical protein
MCCCVGKGLVNKTYFPDFRMRLYTIYAGYRGGPRPPPSCLGAAASCARHRCHGACDNVGVCAFHQINKIPIKINELRASWKLIQNRLTCYENDSKLSVSRG